MFNNLKNIERKRIPDNRNIDGLFLNRAERVKPFDEKIISDINLDLHKMGNYFDLTDFYKKVSDYIGIESDELLVTNGAEEAIRYIFNLLLDKGDTIMFPTPTYGMYHVYTKMYQLDSIILDYNNDFKINKEKLYENLSKVKVFFLPNPSHIEDLFSEDDIINICKILKENNSYLVIDETYYGFGAKSMIHLIKSIENVFVIRSFSKTFGLPSIRIGCLISNDKTMNIISNYRSAYEISYPSLKIAEYFLDNIDIVNNYIQECIEGREYLISELKKNHIMYNGESNYLLNIKIDNQDFCNKVCKNLEDKYIYIRNCKNYIGITIGPIEHMRIFFINFINLYKKLTIKGEFSFIFNEGNDGKLEYIASDDTFDKIYKNNINAWNQNINDDYMLFARNKIIQMIKDLNLKNNKLLEIGCGNGFSTNYFREKLNNKCFGCDISKIAIEYAQNKYSKINFFVHNIKNEMNIDENFDIIIFSDILWYIFDDIDICIKNAINRLNKDGVIIFNMGMVVNQRFGKEKINGSTELIEYCKKRFNVINHYESEFIDRRNLCLIFIKK